MDAYEESDMEVLILGDDHVNQLDHYMLSCDTLPEFNTGLRRVCKPRYLGYMGATVSDLSSTFMLDKIARIEPDIVILHMTNNELDTPLGPGPETVAMRMYAMAKDLVDTGVSEVIVCQMIRPRRWRHFSREDGTELIVSMNNFLLIACSDCSGVQYWRHRGLWNSPTEVFCPDGVTFNDAGNRKLFRSFRGALMLASRRVLQMDQASDNCNANDLA